MKQRDTKKIVVAGFFIVLGVVSIILTVNALANHK